MNENQIKAIKKLGWIVKDCGDQWLLENWSPAGEDLPLEIPKSEDVVIWLWRNYNIFDPDDHVELWIDHRGENGVPYTARELVNDADKIEEMYMQLALTAENAK